ncbi:MAG TPA: hypothetical protein VE079_12685 [Ensifer sp.]|nr:hypothetical protein [Ensifer sp.]
MARSFMLSSLVESRIIAICFFVVAATFLFFQARQQSVALEAAVK